MHEEMSIALQVAILAVQIGVILFAARLAGNLAAKLRMPSVLGELLAGIIIGPYVLGKLGIPLHGFEHGIFPLPAGSSIPVSLPLYSLATIGSIILLFMSGLETDLRQFFRYSVAGTAIGIGGVVFSFAFGAGLGMVMLDAGFMDPRCLFLGILSTATSVGITARILSEKKSIDSPEGTTILAAAVIDDVLGIIFLAIVMGIVGAASMGGSVAWGEIGMIAVKSFGVWLGVTAVGLILAHKIAGFLKLFGTARVFAVLALGLALLLAGLFEQAGLAMIVGAYVMGLCLSKTDIAFAIQHRLEGIYAFMVPVFFVVMGMLVDIRVFANGEVVKFGLIYSALAIAAKILGCALPAFFMNFNLLGSIRIGMGMIPRGEVALIIAGIGTTTMMTMNGQQIPVINSELFGVCIIMTLLTTVAAPPMLSAVLSIRKKGVRKEVADTDSIHTVYTLPAGNIRDFVIRVMQENFRKDGFRHSNVGRDGGIVSFRRGKVVFSLMISENELDFESDANEAVLIKTIMHETFVEIHQTMEDLKDLARPEAFGTLVASDDEGTEKSKKTSIKLAGILPKEAVIMDLEAEDFSDAVKEIIRKLAQSHLLRDEMRCLADVLKRESVFSTCMPGGIAMPHTRTNGVSRLISAIAVSRKGIANADGTELTRIFVLTLSPEESGQPYMQYISHIGKLLIKAENTDRIRQAQTPDELRNIFLGR
ncbi:MAG: cation:proton antiporter [Lentisphaeria bacterium]|nr:cation:proton antiporter [Lentisphaeria bacterium]